MVAAADSERAAAIESERLAPALMVSQVGMSLAAAVDSELAVADSELEEAMDSELVGL
jgi:hypothetical protein